VLNQPPRTKWAAGSNLAFVHYAVDQKRRLAVATCAIDNLGKGAAGQAVQNVNLMLGLAAEMGLRQLPLFP
jgi:N-acetyl-gamma-glutamyl-phosphate reductase